MYHPENMARMRPQQLQTAECQKLSQIQNGGRELGYFVRFCSVCFKQLGSLTTSRRTWIWRERYCRKSRMDVECYKPSAKRKWSVFIFSSFSKYSRVLCLSTAVPVEPYFSIIIIILDKIMIRVSVNTLLMIVMTVITFKLAFLSFYFTNTCMSIIQIKAL